jgi:hypothetical protein
MVEEKDNSRILVIPDLHFPYCHKDALDFLHKLKVKLQPTRVICLGDELDYSAMNFHENNADLPSAGQELSLGLGYIDTLHEIFPKMDLLHSNHGSMAYRRAKHAGMPLHLLKSYNDVLGVSVDDWRWHESLIVVLPDGSKCKFVHGISSNILAASQSIGMSLVQGHHHSLFELRYWSSGYGLNFAITSGCLIDDTSMAFAYNKLTPKRPLIGVTFIENSMPTLIPMSMNEEGRWTGTRI